MVDFFKKIMCVSLAVFCMAHTARADNDDDENLNLMVQKEEFLGEKIYIAGIPQFWPFSYYTSDDGEETCRLHNVFMEPLKKATKGYKLKLIEPFFDNDTTGCDFTPLILGVRDGNYQLFLGAYSDTKQFSGIELIYPAIISNPIHVFALPEKQQEIKSLEDLKKLKGIACQCEYFSDFVTRKIKGLNVEFVETSYDAYERIFTRKADYLIGSLYFNRIMASRYGLERYLASSKKPLFKIPLFMAMSKLTPKLSEYVKLFEKVLADPQFITDVKNEILRVVETEMQNNVGVVPPSFAQVAETNDDKVEKVEEEIQIKGRVIEQKQEQRSMDEILDGI